MREPMAPLDERKQTILKTVVIDYVETAEPVGSRNLLARHRFNVKSATIRNEMSELSVMGYLYKPHTSAGRVPSDMGYRFFVDRLMERTRKAPMEDAQTVAVRRSEIEDIVEETCRLLAQFSRYTSIVTMPETRSAHISHINVSRVSDRKYLIVVLMDNGRVFHHLADTEEKIDWERATNYLSEKLRGLTLEEAGVSGQGCPETRNMAVEGCSATSETSQVDDEFGEILAKVRGYVADELQFLDSADVHVEGTTYIMQQPEFRDVERLGAVLGVLGEKDMLSRLVGSIGDERVHVVIGSENPLAEIRDCSFVASKYKVGDRNAGAIGVIGPTRMDYERAVATVELMARQLGLVLTELAG